MSKILLVDTNISSLPIYKYLVDEGHEVYVVGANPNDSLAKCISNYIQADYSDMNELRRVINQLNIEFIVPGCNDASYKACSMVNEDGQFPNIESPENNEILNNKQKFRDFAISQDLPVPKVYALNEVAASSFPLIVKPVDAYSGRGVNVVSTENYDLLNHAVYEAKQQSKNGTFVIEEFVSGQLYSHSAFIENNKIVWDVIVEEHCVANPFAVDTSRVANNFSPARLKEIKEAVEKISLTLSLKDGLFHTQFICNGNSIRIVEPTRRCPGDLYSRLIELSTGLNYAENYVRPFLGMKYQFSSDPSVKMFIIRHTVTESGGGFFYTLQFNQSVKLKEFVPLMLTGDKVRPAPVGRVGILFIEAQTLDEQNLIFSKTTERKIYKALGM